jgi:hypothetical protein
MALDATDDRGTPWDAVVGKLVTVRFGPVLPGLMTTGNDDG